MQHSFHDFQSFYNHYPEPTNVEKQHLHQRRQKYKCIYQALSSTSPPTFPPGEDLLEFVPTGMEKVGPGNYGSKQIEDGNEVVLLNDEVLTSVPNATLVLIDGNDLERISVLYQFPQFLEHCPRECMDVMVPRICTDSIEWTLDAELAATEALYFVVSRKVPHHIAKHIAWASLLMASKTNSTQLFDACAEIVSLVLPQLHRYDVLNLVVPDAVDRALSEKPHERRLAARVIGSFDMALKREELETIFEDTALTLAQDPDDSVRAMMAQSMASLAAQLSITAAEKRMWPILKQLISDPNVNVRAAAMRSLAKSAQAHSGPEITSPMYETILKPLFFEQCKIAMQVSASDLRQVNDDTYLMLEIFAEVYGYFLLSVSHLFGSGGESWALVLNALRQMVTCNGPTVRHWCAFNMPAVVAVCPKSMSEHLNGVIPALASDSDVETRMTLAAGIHEIARKLSDGPLRADAIRSTNLLFMDTSAQIRMKVLGHFSELLVILSPGENANLESAKAEILESEANVSKDGDQQRDGGKEKTQNEESETGSVVDEMHRLKPMFTSLELMSFDSWRTQKLLADELQKSANLIPQEMLCEHVAPLLFQMARESTFLVRKSAMRALVCTIRYIPDVRRRNHILKHFRNEWARGKVYWTRLAYIDAAGFAKNLFSSRLFTQLFKHEVLGMHNDRVANVRLRLVRFLANVAPIWKKLPEFEASLSNLIIDQDAEVAREANSLSRRIGRIEGLSAIEMEKDLALELAENGFYVHRSRRKRKGHSGRTEDEGERGRANGKTEMHRGQGRRNRHTDSSIASGTELPNGNPRSGGMPHSTIVRASNSPEVITSVNPIAVKSISKRNRRSSSSPAPAAASQNMSSPQSGNDRAPEKKLGFFSRLLSSCFSG